MTPAIFLYDQNRGGHHPLWLQLLSGALLAQGHRVVVLTCEAEALTAWAREQWPEAADRLAVEAIAPVASARLGDTFVLGVVQKPEHWLHARHCVERAAATHGQPAVVLLAWLDAFVGGGMRPWLVDRLFPYPWVGFYFHPRHLRPGGVLRLVEALAPAPDRLCRSTLCRGLLVLDEGIRACLAQRVGKPVLLLPEVTETGLAPCPLADDIRRLAAGRTVVGLCGSLGRRKGLFTLLEAIARLPPERYFFAIVGQFHRGTLDCFAGPALRRFLRRQPENCLVHLARIPDERGLNAVIAECDIVYAAYHDFKHSSGMLTKAAAFRKPVIVSDGYCMAERVRRHGLGLVVRAGHVADSVAAIAALAQPRPPVADLALDYDGYLAHQHAAALHEALAQLFPS